jgi:hypothetical protein
MQPSPLVTNLATITQRFITTPVGTAPLRDQRQIFFASPPQVLLAGTHMRIWARITSTTKRMMIETARANAASRR